MSFYVTDWVKVQDTDEDGVVSEYYCPRGFKGVNMGALDLRPLGTLVGPAIVSAQDGISGAGIVKLGDAKGESLTDALRNAIQTATGFATGQTRIDLILAEIMNASGRLWNPLRPNRHTGVRKLVMNGERIWASIAGGASYAESWNIADRDSISVDLTWTEVLNDLDVVSNRCTLSAAGPSYARCGSVLDSDDHYCQLTARVSVTSGATNEVGACTRFAAAASTFYLFLFQPLDTAQEYNLYSVSTGTLTLINGPVNEGGMAANTDYVIKLASQSDDNHVCSRDGVTKITQSNTTITGNVRAGVYIKANGAERAMADVWSAADIAADGWGRLLDSSRNRLVAA